MFELLLADARTPTGGYAHSGGLEAAVDGGLSADGVPEFMRARLGTVARNQAALAAAAASADRLGGLLALDAEAAARTPVPALRAADRRLGLALLRTAVALWPGDRLLAAYREASTLSPRAVALGVACRAVGIAPVAAARLSLYEDAAGVASAAVKLLPVDTATVTGWVAAQAGFIDDLACEASGRRPLTIPSYATPLLDRRAAAFAPGRLFAS